MKDPSYQTVLGPNPSKEQLLQYFRRMEQVATFLKNNAKDIAPMGGENNNKEIDMLDIYAMANINLLGRDPKIQEPKTPQAKASQSAADIARITRDELVREGFGGVRASTLVETFRAMEDFAGFGRIKDGTLTVGEFSQVTMKLDQLMGKSADEAVAYLRGADRTLKNKLGRSPTDDELYKYYTRVLAVAKQVNSVKGIFGGLDGNPNISINDVLKFQQQYPGVLAPEPR
jgi:hypothetical protein